MQCSGANTANGVRRRHADSTKSNFSTSIKPATEVCGSPPQQKMYEAYFQSNSRVRTKRKAEASKKNKCESIKIVGRGRSASTDRRPLQSCSENRTSIAVVVRAHDVQQTLQNELFNFGAGFVTLASRFFHGFVFLFLPPLFSPSALNLHWLEAASFMLFPSPVALSTLQI